MAIGKRKHPPSPLIVTQGSLNDNIRTLAWPNIFNQALSMAPSLYDAIWLGRLGSEAPAAAGLASSVRFTMVSVLMALSLGSGAVVARYVGAKDRDGANLAALQGLILMMLTAGSLSLAGVLLARPLMILAGADAVTLPYAVRYARIFFAGLIGMEMVPSVGYMLNAAGESRVMLNMSLIGAGMLLVFEPLLVKWLGLEGAALAMVGSNLAGTLWGLGVLCSGHASIQIDLRRIHLDWKIIARIVRISLPAVIQRGSPNLAASILIRLVSAYGAPTLSAWVIGQRIFSVAMAPGMGLSRTAPALVGQNLGANKAERAEQAVKLVARYAVGASVVVFSLLAIWPAQAMSIFTSDIQVIAIGAHAIRLLCIGYLVQSMTWVFDSALGGAGDTVSPMVLNMIVVWLIELPLAFVLPRWTGLRIDGIWLAMIVAWVILAGSMIWWFRQGRWKLKRV